MNIIIIFLFLAIVMYLYKLVNYAEHFKLCDRSIQNLAPMPLLNQDKRMFDKKDKGKPWCKPWCYNKNKLKCYVNKHLQRKCIWSCE